MSETHASDDGWDRSIRDLLLVWLVTVVSAGFLLLAGVLEPLMVLIVGGSLLGGVSILLGRGPLTVDESTLVADEDGPDTGSGNDEGNGSSDK
ncbi:hypothetical protein [Halobaculum magnesiiphilum]|uniref:Uncharacterized protein n=1 Tax=Halobaculum magnesiiphilum TaxID=1017351 RepID=A0A8T8W984_9EURY|nr:hypothetical protein [Halobaculum magnesiiphilum]QZP36422.1 hypothetical protein K6T50_08755 [Halobaculum magnesiiphilum]